MEQNFYAWHEGDMSRMERANKRLRKILKRRLIDGITYERLAEEFDLSVAQIKRIVYKGENIIF